MNLLVAMWVEQHVLLFTILSAFRFLSDDPAPIRQSPHAWDILNLIGKGSRLLAIPFWCSYTVLKTKSRGKPSPLWEYESNERLIHTARKTALTICCSHLGL